MSRRWGPGLGEKRDWELISEVGRVLREVRRAGPQLNGENRTAERGSDPYARVSPNTHTLTRCASARAHKPRPLQPLSHTCGASTAPGPSGPVSHRLGQS